MFLPFFDNLRANNVPVSLREYLAFLEGMKAGLVTYEIEGFYYLARAAMVKDERNLDKFDRVFSDVFKGMEELRVEDILNAVDVPEDWLTKLAEKHLSPEEMKEIEALGGVSPGHETHRRLNAIMQGISPGDLYEQPEDIKYRPAPVPQPVRPSSAMRLHLSTPYVHWCRQGKWQGLPVFLPGTQM